jgi:hypothetical protein
VPIPADHHFTVHTYPEPQDIATVRLIAHPPHHHPIATQPIRVHVDGGTNRLVTNDSDILINLRNIKRYAMQGDSDGPAIQCTALGFFPWQSDNGEVLQVKCYYCAEVAETILSPTDIITNHINDLKHGDNIVI